MALKREVVTDTLAHVRIAHVGREAAKAWNRTRAAYDTQAFCGWFWITRRRVGGARQEGGPFSSYSAAMRDAYYRFVRRTQTPLVGSATEDAS